MLTSDSHFELAWVPASDPESLDLQRCLSEGLVVR